ncbi:hypothetical protein CAL26_05855 [Bordetella genomosp. 9]|uniref:Zinc finger Ogr/Delta-type domain-containing protein n=1 Tax=Bordetella genomosp. 9 TaxID=1416803 RepID=A0A261RP57_9BORD|nr:hypothetical protein CAL26_05855 [Bordetella genomosp. 9]
MQEATAASGIAVNTIGQHCPHCGHFATVRTSETMSPTLRVLYFQCRSLFCGHTWVSHLEAVRTVSPPAIANPAIDLPLASRADILRKLAESKTDPRQGSFLHEHD